MNEFTVVAESAPIGVLLWPVVAPRFAPCCTLAAVTVDGDVVTWVYQSGEVRYLRRGDVIVCRNYGPAPRADRFGILFKLLLRLVEQACERQTGRPRPVVMRPDDGRAIVAEPFEPFEVAPSSSGVMFR